MIPEAATAVLANHVLRDVQGSARAAKAVALRSVGATEQDLQATVTRGIPPAVLVAVALAIGGVLGVRYIPERWQNKIRRFGK